MSERSAVLRSESVLHPRSQLSEVSIPVLTSGINHRFPGSEPWELDFQGGLHPPAPVVSQVEASRSGDGHEVGSTCERR